MDTLPPDAPSRHGATILELEHACLTAVPAPRVGFDGPFVVRAHRGGTGRGNAATPLDPGFDPWLATRIPRIEGFYRGLGLQPRFRSTPLDPAGLGMLLAERGWVRFDETRVMTAPRAAIAREDAEVRILPGPEPAWLAVLATAEYQVAARRAEKLDMPDLLAASAGWFLLDGAAAAFGVATGRLCGVFDVATDPARRRQGLSRRVLGALAAWGAARGADTLFLQVALENEKAHALYAALGFEERYRYAYWRPGA